MSMYLGEDEEILSSDENSYDEGESSTNPQNLSFTRKLFEILKDANNRHIILWNRDGRSFEVLDPRGLETEVLPKYFRHARFQSLVRQLNFYAFKKVGKERSSWIYYHDCFRRDEPELLKSLKRKTNGGAREALAAKARARVRKLKERRDLKEKRDKLTVSLVTDSVSIGSGVGDFSSPYEYQTRRTARSISLDPLASSLKIDTRVTDKSSVKTKDVSDFNGSSSGVLNHVVTPGHVPSLQYCSNHTTISQEILLPSLFLSEFFSSCAYCNGAGVLKPSVISGMSKSSPELRPLPSANSVSDIDDQEEEEEESAHMVTDGEEEEEEDDSELGDIMAHSADRISPSITLSKPPALTLPFVSGISSMPMVSPSHAQMSSAHTALLETMMREVLAERRLSVTQLDEALAVLSSLPYEEATFDDESSWKIVLLLQKHAGLARELALYLHALDLPLLLALPFFRAKHALLQETFLRSEPALQTAFVQANYQNPLLRTTTMQQQPEYHAVSSTESPSQFLSLSSTQLSSPSSSATSLETMSSQNALWEVCDIMRSLGFTSLFSGVLLAHQRNSLVQYFLRYCANLLQDVRQSIECWQRKHSSTEKNAPYTNIDGAQGCFFGHFDGTAVATKLSDMCQQVQDTLSYSSC